MANLFQPNGQICSGNPGYTCNGCETGTKAGTDIKTVGTLPCNGCQKVIIANQINQNPSYDMKSYFNIKPGYYWQYEGINKINNTLFETRVTAEEKTTVCGHELFPLRFTKNKKEGYILADRLMNFRIFISNFQTGELWSSNTIGKLISKNYRMDPNASNLLNNLGQEIFKGDPDFVGNRHMTQDGKRTFENNYFAPHLFIEQYVNNGWSIEKIDRLMSDEKQSFESCNWTYQPSMIERYTKNSLHADYVDTPAYKGPVVRLRLIEGDNHGTGWYIREDWYFAKDIGRVQVDWKDLRQKCNHGNYTVNSPDLDCTNPAKMVNPDISMKLKSYYAGGPLTITVNPSTVSKTGKRTFYVKNNKGIPYTGQLEAKTCISESRCTPGKPFDWAYWVENGIVITDLSKISDHQTGLRHSFFRPWIETTPKGAVGETITGKTELPWSQEIQMRVQ
ncbi:hypothetical protein KKB06_04545 [Patescibacteria group bacterium]|nr:hypothetical protein [Patescibacteria group bacterium]